MSNSMKPSGEANKAGKRKGTRSVSTLTPSQLARKRANDREAQRAIRARTKEHIESLEREIEGLRSHQDRDQTIQTLLRRNKTLENELHHLKESMGIRTANTNEQYHHGMHPILSSAYDLATKRFTVFNSSSPPGSHSFGQSGPSFPVMQNISYNNIPDTTEGWPATGPCSLPSTASSPVSSVGTDDFGGNYIPSGAPTTVYERSSIPPNARSPTISCVNGEGTFDDSKPGMFPTLI
ncbi:putative bzip transcription factor protein [Daldinia childiae]|uniref:putative bzip transcription factor protein n=1 Tax=Daldinia childiae TaxID=326645 RepID=UPI0014452875|nr:putative bzip transcription factor protein [Daldinia childiae]KAF3058597.1 putative bzip transcription factor protein [Daldinia childiae]